MSRVYTELIRKKKTSCSETLFYRVSVTKTFDPEIPSDKKKSFDPPICPFFLSILRCPYFFLGCFTKMIFFWKSIKVNLWKYSTYKNSCIGRILKVIFKLFLVDVKLMLFPLFQQTPPPPPNLKIPLKQGGGYFLYRPVRFKYRKSHKLYMH